MAVKKSALATVGMFETRHGVAANVDTSLIEQCIDGATDFIEGNADRKMKARNYNGFGTEFDHDPAGSGLTVESENYLYFNGDSDEMGDHGGGIFFLPAYPILKPQATQGKTKLTHYRAVTFVLQRLSARDASGDTWETLTENVDYTLEEDRGVIKATAPWSNGTKNYRVTATLGFSDGSAQPFVEAGLSGLCLYIAGKLYREETDKTSTREGSSSNEIVPLEDDRYVNDTLAKYRRL